MSSAAPWRTLKGTKTLMTAAKDNTVASNAATTCLTKVSQARVSASISTSSNLGKFLRIPKPSRSTTDDLLTKFIKLHNKQNPAMRMNMLSLEKMKSLVEKKERVGFPEITKLMSS